MPFPAFGVWLVLMGASALSWWLGGDGYDTRQLATIGVLVVAFAKVWLVGWRFMEIREAPTALRLVFTSWTVVVCAALVGIYLG